MAKWGNALGGWRRQRRNSKGQFSGGSSSKIKAAKSTAKKKSDSKKSDSKNTAKKAAPKRTPRKKTTISRSNGTTYRTTQTKGLIPGRSTVETVAYHQGEFKGSLSGYHSKKGGTKVDFLYVAEPYRGTGVSQGLASRQLYHARRNGGGISVTGQRSVGGQKFVDRNQAKGVKINSRDRSMSSTEITQLMEDLGQIQAKKHAKNYQKTKAKAAANARKAKARKAKARKNRKPMSAQKKAAIGAGVVVRTVFRFKQEMEKTQKETVASGRKVVIHRLRSEDSERIVRNQARKLNSPKKRKRARRSGVVN